MSQSQSGSSTPGFTQQAQTAEDLLKEQTVGLVHLSDFRKRRADAVEQTSTTTDGREPTLKPAFKKKKKATKSGGLSFGDDEVESSEPTSLTTTRSATPADPDGDNVSFKKKLKPNSGIALVPKSQSKSALARETQVKEALKKEYLQLQEAVKATDFMIPFVLFDGKDTIGGKVRMKKGDQVWLFLERARKVGAESGKARKDWARISVDDLMMVRQDLIIPPHLDFHHFVVNNARGYRGPLFDLAASPTLATPAELLSGSDNASEAPSTGLSHPKRPAVADADLEGFLDEPSTTRVVDRRWYEKNKHIYPATIWEDFDAQRDYSKGGRKDRDGNQMFFS